MEKTMTYDFPHSGNHKYVSDYIKSLPDLSGKTVLDIPCGDGRASYEFQKKGATVIALDLFPEFFKLNDLKAEYADLSEAIPLESGTVDYIICQEGIEHLPNQLFAMEEFNRVLKKGGIFLITTPNNSHVRARISTFFMETDYWQRMPPTEIDGIWFAKNSEDKLYFGHLFLLGVQHLQSLVRFSGFTVKRRIRTDIGRTSLITGLALYPLLFLFSMASFLFYRRKNPRIEKRTRDQILWERVKLNLSPKTLFCKQIIWELQKKEEIGDMLDIFKKMVRI